MLSIAKPLVNQEPAVGAIVVEPVQAVFHLPTGYSQAEVIAGHALDVVGFVDDQHVVVGQNADSLHPQRQIAEQEGMIDDQDLCVGQPPPGLEVEAFVVVVALPAHAVAAFAGNFVPNPVHRSPIHVGKRSVVALLRPLADVLKLLEFLLVAKQGGSPFDRVFQPPPAEIVAPSLDQNGSEFQRDHAIQERQVLADQLLLQADGVSGYHHPPYRIFRFVGPCRVKDCGHQVGETLAHARACFGY